MTVSIAIITGALDQLTTVSKDSALLAQDVGQSTSAAHSQIFTDFTLTESGKQQRLSTVTGDIRAQAQTLLGALTVQGNGAYSTLERAMQENRPQRGNDAASVIVAQQRWDQTRELLSAGISLVDLIATSDLVTTLAIEEFAPMWLIGQKRIPQTREDLADFFDEPSMLVRSVLSRLIELTTDEVAFALTSAHDAGIVMDQARLWWTTIQGMIDGRSTNYLNTAIAVEYLDRSLSTRLAKVKPQLAVSDPSSYMRYTV